MNNFLVVLAVFWSVTLLAQTPIPHGHAHNDYMHNKPLVEALENGFTSIEIDVHLYQGQLKVAHDCVALANKPNIEDLYLKPIEERIKQNGGTVYKGYEIPVIFMIDFKTGGETYTELKKVLNKYKYLLTPYKNGNVIKLAPLQILISGSKPYGQVAKEDTSYVTIDGTLKDLEKPEHDKIITRYSDPWPSQFSWKGNGDMPEKQKAHLKELVAAAHAKGKDIRFYGIPDKPKVWETLLNAGVDWINTDKLAQFHSFMLNKGAPVLQK